MKKNNIKKKLAYSIITLFLLCNISSLAYGTNESSKSHITTLTLQNEVWVNDDYPNETTTHFKTIQGGVNGVNTSGTVYVCNGTYNEHVIINRTMKIMGHYAEGYDNDSYPPIVSDSASAFIIIGINANGTEISHFNITGCMVSGVLVLSSRLININYNSISLNKRGIYIISSPSCYITHNNVINNLKEGMVLESSNGCTVNGNYVVNNNLSGIELSYCNSANISSNNISLNGNYNIWIGTSTSPERNIISRNNIIDKENYKHFWIRRWVASKNLWNNNYWSDYKGPSLWYFVRGTYIIGFGLPVFIPQIDFAPETVEYNYPPNVI